MVLSIKPGPTRTTIYRSDFAKFHEERLSDFVVSGYTVPASSGSLSLVVAAGIAYISGWRVEHSEANSVTFTDEATNYVFLDKDGNFTVNTTGSAPSDGIQICSGVAAGGQITSTTDSRPLTAVEEDKVNFLEKTDGQMYVGISLMEPASGTWAADESGGVPSLDRTAADAEHEVIVDLPLRNRKASSRGVKVTSIEVIYEVGTADIDDITFTIYKLSLQATGNAMSASSQGFSYDSSHNTAAERKTVGHHTMVCTITSPAYLGNDEGLIVLITVDGSATGVLKLKGLQVYYSEKLI